MKHLYIFLINKLAQLYLWRYRPVVIGVTGNVGKTTTKEAIATVLSADDEHSTRSSEGNLNNDVGLPLTILGRWPEFYEKGPNFLFWVKVILVSLWRFIFGQTYPAILILEYGADKPGDIRRLARRFRPHIAVVTAVGEVPVHVENFKNREELAYEKAELVACLGSTGHAILNRDDPIVWAMAGRTEAKVHGFGRSEESEIYFDNYEVKLSGRGVPTGISFKLFHGRHTYIPIQLEDCLGVSQGYAISAASLVGLIQGMNLVKISQALSRYQGVPGRLRVLSGIKGSIIVDDTYNASPASMTLALETLFNLSASRRIAVLGDMLELGEHTIPAHQRIGELIAGRLEWLICIGGRSKFIADGARQSMPEDRIIAFDTSGDARTFVQELIQAGDLVLVKGSQGMRMERVVEEIMAEPERRRQLLVRQSISWLKKD